MNLVLTHFVVITCNSYVTLDELRLANAKAIGLQSLLREVDVILAHMVLSRYTTTCI